MNSTLNRILGVVFLFLLFGASARATDAPRGLEVRERLARALDRVGMCPGDLQVRDVRKWRINEQRYREMGIMVGEFPLPSESDPLRPRLVDLALRSPVSALTLGLKLDVGMSPAELRGLVSGNTMAIPCSAANRWKPPLVRALSSLQVRPESQ